MLSRTQRTAWAASSTQAGKSYLGIQPVVRNHDHHALAGERVAEKPVLLLRTVLPAPAVDENDDRGECALAARAIDVQALPTPAIVGRVREELEVIAEEHGLCRSAGRASAGRHRHHTHEE